MKKTVFMLMMIFAFLPGCMVIDFGSVTNDDKPKLLCRPCPWEIKFVFSIVSGYKPTEKYGKLKERYQNVEINVYNEQIGEYVVIEHKVYYTVDDEDRKRMVVEALVPEQIKNVTKEKLKYYASYVFDGRNNATGVFEVTIKEVPCE